MEIIFNKISLILEISSIKTSPLLQKLLFLKHLYYRNYFC